MTSEETSIITSNVSSKMTSSTASDRIVRGDMKICCADNSIFSSNEAHRSSKQMPIQLNNIDIYVKVIVKCGE